MADGLRLAIRPLGPSDRGGLAALFARLSPDSRYQRFLSPKPELAPRELTYLTDIDHITHDALAAIDPRDGSIVGVGRYAADPGLPLVAHIAVAVADELHGLGIGTALATRAVERARANGYTLLIATTLWENRRARALARRLGFRARGSYGSVVELALELAPVPREPISA
jgi:RimJ/RimL family protein N-acetyltransferase